MHAAMTEWSAAEAKVHFSKMVEAAHKKPQIILKHGKPVGVLVDWELYRERLSAHVESLQEYLSELNDIHAAGCEGDFEILPRSDRNPDKREPV